MTNEQLFQALAGVKPEYLDHSEGALPARKRLMPRIILVAAVVASMIGTALAVPYIRNYLKNLYGRTYLESGAITDLQGETHVLTGMLDVYVALDLEPDRPQSIEEAYLPMYFVENWETVQEYAPNYQADWDKNRHDIALEWISEDGRKVSYYQTTVNERIAEDCPEYEIDSVNTGYNDQIQVEQVTIGEYDLYRVVVPPSTVTMDGTVHTADGMRKYYWSDGRYLFWLELSWDVDESLVELALSSMKEVEDISDFQHIEYYEPDPEGWEWAEPGDIMLYPTWLPEGWRRNWAGCDGNGYYNFNWDHQDEGSEMTSNLELNQMDIGEIHWMRFWENGTWEGTKQNLIIGDWDVTIYYNESRIHAGWIAGDHQYILETDGMERISMDDLIRILENMEFIDDPQSLLEGISSTTVLYPEWIPDGWDLQRSEQVDGFYSFAWQHQVQNEPVFSHLYLEQMEHGFKMNSWLRIWSPMKGTKEILDINGMEITIWYNDTRIDAFWYVGDVDCVLSSDGENKVSLEEMIRILESLSEWDRIEQD